MQATQFIDNIQKEMDLRSDLNEETHTQVKIKSSKLILKEPDNPYSTEHRV